MQYSSEPGMAKMRVVELSKNPASWTCQEIFRISGVKILTSALRASIAGGRWAQAGSDRENFVLPRLRWKELELYQ